MSNAKLRHHIPTERDLKLAIGMISRAIVHADDIGSDGDLLGCRDLLQALADECTDRLAKLANPART